MFSESFKDRLRPLIPEPILRERARILRTAQRISNEYPLRRLSYYSRSQFSISDRRKLVARVLEAGKGIECAHQHSHMAAMLENILSLDDAVKGCIVEAGCFKGGSTAKLSIAAKMTNRKLVVFDSFAGLPHDEEPGFDIYGEKALFWKGTYCGQLEEVTENVRHFGEIEVCEFVRGWFEDTLPSFHEPVAMAFVDVDLVSSTRTCLQYLYPPLVKGASIFSMMVILRHVSAH